MAEMKAKRATPAPDTGEFERFKARRDKIIKRLAEAKSEYLGIVAEAVDLRLEFAMTQKEGRVPKTLDLPPFSYREISIRAMDLQRVESSKATRAFSHP